MEHRNSHLQLFLAHRAALIDYAAPIVGCRSRAEDVVQDAFIRFTAAGAEGRDPEPIANPISYLYRIVRNLALDWTRRPAENTFPEYDDIARIPATMPSAEQALLYRDELRVLAEALAELPERTRYAFTMHRIEGRTLQDIATELGISVVRVHYMVKEAVLHAAKRLDEKNRG